MSVLIKDMDMPKEGVYNAVITFDGDSISVRIPPSKKPFFSGRIVHIPTLHGRLIDEEAIYNNVKSRCNNCHIRACAICGVTSILNDIRTAPTIIEAEVSE